MKKSHASPLQGYSLIDKRRITRQQRHTLEDVLMEVLVLVEIVLVTALSVNARFSPLMQRLLIVLFVILLTVLVVLAFHSTKRMIDIQVRFLQQQHQIVVSNRFELCVIQIDGEPIVSDQTHKLFKRQLHFCVESVDYLIIIQSLLSPTISLYRNET